LRAGDTFLNGTPNTKFGPLEELINEHRTHPEPSAVPPAKASRTFPPALIAENPRRSTIAGISVVEEGES
jgi:hypothetical protein